MDILPDVQRARRNTIGDAVERMAAKFRDRPALHFGGRSWTCRDVAVASGRIAARLQAAGLQPGDRVAAFGRNSAAYLLIWLGCCRAGLVHVPANYALTAGELAYLLGQSGAALLLHDPALVATAREAAGPATLGTLHGGVGLDMLTAADDPSLMPAEVLLDDAAPAQIIYTSGTTSVPKGALMSHGGMIAEYLSNIIELEISPGDRALAALPLYHTAQLHCFTMPLLLRGGETFLLEAPAPEVCLRCIEAHRITSFFAPPTVWINLLRHPDFDRRNLSSLTHVYYGAAIMPVPVLQELRRRLPGIRPFNCYGQSEIAPLATVLRPEEHDARPASVGCPVLNVATRIVDLDGADVPPGTPGEIVHRSSQLLLGYWAKPEETRAAFEGGWFHSGDVGVMDAEGYITVVDRMKDVINTGGVLVASREVEDALFTHPSVSEVAVIAVPDPVWVEAIAAIVVLRPGMDATAEALIAHARTTLAAYKVPKRVIFADSLPRNTAGKLLKREMRMRYGGSGSAALA